MRSLKAGIIFSSWLMGVLWLSGQVTASGTTVTTQDKSDPMGFPLEIRSSTLMKPKIMSLVVSVKGESNRFLANDESFKLVPGRLVPSKGLFIVPVESQVIFRPMPGITTLLAEDTRLQVKGLSVVKKADKISKRKAFLYLNEGSVFTSIQKLNNRTTSYEIQTPQAIASAKGTKFWVHYRNGKGKVGVVNGVVSVALTNGTVILLKQNEFLDLTGIGPELKAGDVRPATEEEIRLSEMSIQSVAAVEGVTSSAVNPFLTTSEAFKNESDAAFERSSDSDRVRDALEDSSSANGSPNSSNTSGTTTVSPVGP
ncbi:MAG: FecR domain-containing protein [Verrucomicrobiota bacterium]